MKSIVVLWSYTIVVVTANWHSLESTLQTMQVKKKLYLTSLRIKLPYAEFYLLECKYFKSYLYAKIQEYPHNNNFMPVCIFL